MGEYINKYANSAAIQAAVDGGELIKPYVALDESTGLIDWNTKFIDYANMPLTFEILSDGNIRILYNTPSTQKTIEYSINDGEWTSFTYSNSKPLSIDVFTGDKIRFRGDNQSYGTQTNSTVIGSTNLFKVYGNIMSLISSNNYTSLTTISQAGCFNSMFQGCTGLTDASNLILPATTLAGDSYYGMFQNCTSLTTAPELPATTLASFCYASMFYGCTSLNYIKCLATDISATLCTSTWVNNVASTGTFVTPSSTAWSTGNNGIPSGWTRVDA